MTFIRAFLRLRRTELWKLAKQAVNEIHGNLALKNAAQLEAHLPFCPRCGQRPDGDRRMEEAREHVMLRLKNKEVKRRDLDFALAYFYWGKRL